MKNALVSDRHFHPIVNTLLAGTVFMIIGLSMSSPFLAIYLAKNNHLSAALIGVAIGFGPLSGAFGGFLGGVISDLIGRKYLLILSLFLSSAVFFGYAFTRNTILIICFICIGGIASSIFTTVSRALIADLTSINQRVKVFSLQNLALNIGWGIGPVIGIIFGMAASQIPFIITGVVYAIYAVALWTVLRLFKLNQVEYVPSEKTTIKESLHVMTKDKALLFFVIASIILAIGWAQFPVLLSEYVTSSFDRGTEVFGILLVINAVVIIIFQLPMSKWVEKKSPIFSLLLGVMFASLGLLGFGISFNFSMLIGSISLVSLAETLVVPVSNVMLDEIAPDNIRGAYFGAQNFGLFGMVLSPVLGGYILDIFGGRVMYTVLSIICASSAIFFYLCSRVYSYKKSREIGQSFSA